MYSVLQYMESYTYVHTQEESIVFCIIIHIHRKVYSHTQVHKGKKTVRNKKTTPQYYSVMKLKE